MLEAELRNIIKSITENSNQLAFQKLFEHFFPRLNAFSYSIIKNHQRSQEIVQDVFLKVWNNRENLTSISNISTYFYILIKNKSIDELRNKSNLKCIDILDIQDNKCVINNWNAELSYISKERMMMIENAINNLPEKCRFVFQLVKIEGLKYSEVAHLLEISVRTVEAHIAIALKKLMEALKGEFPQVVKKTDR